MKRRLSTMMLAVVTACTVMMTTGCEENNGEVTRDSIFRTSADSNKEHWTILCRYYDAMQAPDHAVVANQMADMLREVKQLKAKNVRVETTEEGSSLYYGDYTKVSSRESATLVFPKQFQSDVELIRSLTYQRFTPFFHAQPKLLGQDVAQRRGPYHVSNARDEFSLLIARFYNTATFDDRINAAESYTKLLRDEGFLAFYDHQDVRSFVYVGEFNAGDYQLDRNGFMYFSERVKQLIARKPQEFTNVTDNGHLITHVGSQNSITAETSHLVDLTGDNDNVYRYQHRKVIR